MTDIITAKNILSQQNATFVAVKNEEIYISHKRGVTPIIEKIDENSAFFSGATVADKVTGKAAAMLLVKYGVKELHTGVISRNALSFLADKNITVTYDGSSNLFHLRIYFNYLFRIIGHKNRHFVLHLYKYIANIFKFADK